MKGILPFSSYWVDILYILYKIYAGEQHTPKTKTAEHNQHNMKMIVNFFFQVWNSMIMLWEKIFCGKLCFIHYWQKKEAGEGVGGGRGGSNECLTLPLILDLLLLLGLFFLLFLLYNYKSCQKQNTFHRSAGKMFQLGMQTDVPFDIVTT